MLVLYRFIFLFYCYSILDQIRKIHSESNKHHNIQIMEFKQIRCIMLIMCVVVIQTSITTGLEVYEVYPSENFLRQLLAYGGNVFLKPKTHDFNLHGLRRHVYQLSLRRKRILSMQPKRIPYHAYPKPIKRVVCDRGNNRNCKDMFNFFNRF